MSDLEDCIAAITKILATNKIVVKLTTCSCSICQTPDEQETEFRTQLDKLVELHKEGKSETD